MKCNYINPNKVDIVVNHIIDELKRDLIELNKIKLKNTEFYLKKTDNKNRSVSSINYNTMIPVLHCNVSNKKTILKFKKKFANKLKHKLEELSYVSK